MENTKETEQTSLKTEELEKKLKNQKLAFNIPLVILLLAIISYFYFGLIKDIPINNTFIVIFCILVIIVFATGIKLDKMKKELKKRKQ